MLKFLSDILEVVRPYGLRRLVAVCAMVLVQAIIQLISVFSFLPFLSAASDMDQFRASKVGAVFIDLIGAGSDARILLVAGLASLAIMVVGNATTLSIEFARAAYGARLGHEIRIQNVRHLLNRRYEYFLGVNSSHLMKVVIDDVDRFVQLLLVPTLDIFARSILVILLAGSILVLEPLVCGIAVAAIAVYFVIIIQPIRRRASRTSETVRVDLSQLYVEMGQILTGIKPIIASDQRAYFVGRCNEPSERLAKEFPLIPLYGAIPRSGLEILVFGGLIAWVLITLVSGGNIVSVMPRVALVAIVAYRLLPSLQLVITQAMNIVATRQSMDELLGLARSQRANTAVLSQVTDAEGRLEWDHELVFENVSFTYAGAERPTINNVSFVIRKGEHVAFLGTTGAGKSTLVDLLLGLLLPTSGRILVDGVPLDFDRIRSWRRSVGYVPQDLFLLDRTIAENVAFGFQSHELDFAKVLEVTERAHARGFVEKHKDGGFWSLVGERGVRLSGGQRQRLALARALYPNPSVLVMDEGTSALDPRTEQAILGNITENDKDLTIIAVTHRLHTVEGCDRIYFIEQGAITASGTYETLVETHPGFREFAK